MSKLRARAGAPRPWYHVGPVLALKDEAAPAPAEKPASSADVYVFDVIGGWFGVSADDFVREVASLDVDRIVLHLNTPGGDAAEGVAIANVLRAHRAEITVRVDGIAASAGSVIAMAGDEVIMSIGSQMMIHDAWGYAQGNAAEMAQAQRMLDSTSDAIAATYAAKTGGTAAEWRDIMRAEAWYTPEEAVTAGLADRVAPADETGTAEGEQITPGGSGGLWGMWDSLRDPERLDLSAFTYAGRSAAPAPPIPARKSAAAPRSVASTTDKEGSRPVAFSDEQLTALRTRLGVADDADEQTILTALDEALDERAEPEAAPPLPEGTVAIDSATLAALRTSAQRGEEARAQQEAERREALVEAAVGDGRIAPARRAAWLTQLERDPGAAETLAALEPGLIPVGKPLGHDAGAPQADAAAQGDDYWFPGHAAVSTSREG